MENSIANNFISSIDNDEERVMHSNEADETINELFDLLENRD